MLSLGFTHTHTHTHTSRKLKRLIYELMHTSKLAAGAGFGGGAGGSSPAETDGLSSGGDDHRLDGGQEPAREGVVREGGREGVEGELEGAIRRRRTALE